MKIKSAIKRLSRRSLFATCYSLFAIRYLLFAICYPLIIIPCLYAVGTTAGEFLKILPGARASAMAGAFTAISDDKTALYYNPAGLSQIELNEVAVSYNKWILDTSLSTLIYGHTWGETGSAAIGITYYDSGDIEERQNTKDLIGSYKNTGLSCQLGYGNELFEGFSLGLAAKFITETIKDKSTTGFSGDFGVHYKTIFDFGETSFGLAVQNIGSKLWDDFNQPSLWRAGASVKPIKNLLTISADYISPFAELSAGTFSIGSEVQLSEMFSLRTGYRFNLADVSGLSALTAGFGFRYIQDYDYIFNYSFSTQGDLGLSHRAEVGFGF